MNNEQVEAPKLWTPGQEIDEFLPNEKIMSRVHTAARYLLHPEVVYEDGTQEQLAQDKEDGVSYLILMTHFSRMEVLHIADVSNDDALEHIKLNTGITAREELFNLWWKFGKIVRESGAHPVGRGIERFGESTEEKLQRQQSNQNTQKLGAKFLASGYNWLIFPEGGSKVVLTDDQGVPLRDEDNKVIREKRNPHDLMEFQYGFVDTIDYLTDEEKNKVKMLGMVAQYPDSMFGWARPTIAVTNPESIEGVAREDKMQQGLELMNRGLEVAVNFDKQYRTGPFKTVNRRRLARAA